MLKLFCALLVVTAVTNGLPAAEDKSPQEDLSVQQLSLNTPVVPQEPAPGSVLKTPTNEETLSDSDGKDETLDKSETIWGLGFGRPYYGRYYGGWGGYGGYGGYGGWGGGYGGYGRGFYGGWRRPYYGHWGGYW